MGAKSQFLQIRVTPSEKAALRRLARRAGQDVSAYVLRRALPPAGDRFEALIRSLAAGTKRRFILAELNDFLTGMAPAAFEDALGGANIPALPPLDANYVAAMVEHAAALKGVRPPAWTREVLPLDEPWFATPMRSLRPHLLRSAPVAFRRRNLFVDSSVGDRV